MITKDPFEVLNYDRLSFAVEEMAALGFAERCYGYWLARRQRIENFPRHNMTVRGIDHVIGFLWMVTNFVLFFVTLCVGFIIKKIGRIINKDWWVSTDALMFDRPRLDNVLVGLRCAHTKRIERKRWSHLSEESRSTVREHVRNLSEEIKICVNYGVGRDPFTIKLAYDVIQSVMKDVWMKDVHS